MFFLNVGLHCCFTESQPLSSGYSGGAGPIFLSRLDCSGHEQSLLECSSDYPVGLHQCDHSMDVGLHCLGVCINVKVHFECQLVSKRDCGIAFEICY